VVTFALPWPPFSGSIGLVSCKGAAMIEKEIYQQVMSEMEAGTIDNALWSMAWTKAEGDEGKAKARYVEERVKEIRATSLEVTKRARRRIRQQHLRRWFALAITALCFSVANQIVVNSIVPYNNRPRWDFFLIGLFASTCGYLVLPGIVVLASWGRLWGYRVAVLALLLAGCFSGIGGQPTGAQLMGRVGQSAMPEMSADPKSSRRFTEYSASDGKGYTFTWEAIPTQAALEQGTRGLEERITLKREEDAASAKSIYTILCSVCLIGWVFYAWWEIGREKYNSQIAESIRWSESL
jgi:hypothetical protein